MESGGEMIVVRFRVRCRPEKIEQALAGFAAVIAPSRALDGVVSFDIGRDLADPDSIIATEVFEDRAALDRQESLPEVQNVLRLLEELLAAEPEATIFHVSSSEPHGG
jgi:quinol monooxygenase YgiN